MNHKATITHVYQGVENKTFVEDNELATFYARVTGTVQGILLTGEHVTNLETHDKEPTPA